MSQSSSDQRTVNEKSNGYWFLKKLNPFSKTSEEIEPSEENSSQSGSGQMTVDEKSNGKVHSTKLSEENLSQSSSSGQMNEKRIKERHQKTIVTTTTIYED